MRKTILILIGFSIFYSVGLGQNQFAKGVDFWFGFQENILTPSISIAISSSRNTSGIISIPLAGWSQAFNITADSVTQISVPLSLGMATFTDIAEAKAIHIAATDTISVVALNTSVHSTDATTLLPLQLLGNSYYIFSYQGINGAPVSEFLVVPIDTNTTVQITPSDNTDAGHAANISYNVTLQQGEIYQIKSTYGDLTSSYITSAKPIAVFGGHQCAIIPSGAWCDHLYEQMYPVVSWGMDFITMPLKTRFNGDTYKMMASQDSTSITINNGVPFYLNTGQSYELIIINPSRIIANKPIAVAHYSNSQTYDNVSDSDPFIIILSHIDNVAYKSVFRTFAVNFIAAHYLNVLTKTNNVGQVKLDGVFINPLLFDTIPSTIYSYAQLTITNGIHKLESDTGFIAYAYGYGNAESYGYAVGDIKLSNPTGIENEYLSMNNIIEIFPNPFSSKTVIRFNYAYKKDFVIIITDIEGKILLSEKIFSTNEYILERKYLSSGLYFVQVRNNSEIMATKKLIIE